MGKRVAVRFGLSTPRRVVLSFERGPRGVGSMSIGKRATHCRFRGRRVVLPRGGVMRKGGGVAVGFVTKGRSLGEGSRFLCALLIPSHTHALFPYFRRPGLGTAFSLQLSVPAR